MKKTIKIIFVSCFFVFIIFALLIANSIFGNPISHFISSKTAEKLLEENYSKEGYKLKGVFYNFKYNSYIAKYYVPESMDKHFEAYISSDGKFLNDNYESITKGYNTLFRLEKEYSDLLKPITEKLEKKYNSDILFATLIGDSKDSGINPENLIIDKKYDLNQLGKNYGIITAYINYGEGSFEDAVKIIRDIDSSMREAGLEYKIIDFNLSESLKSDEEKPGSLEYSISIRDLDRDKIKKDDEAFIKILKTENEKTAQYYKKNNEKK